MPAPHFAEEAAFAEGTLGPVHERRNAQTVCVIGGGGMVVTRVGMVVGWVSAGSFLLCGGMLVRVRVVVSRVIAGRFSACSRCMVVTGVGVIVGRIGAGSFLLCGGMLMRVRMVMRGVGAIFLFARRLHSRIR